MKRLLVHVEGQTEEAFVNDVLRPHLVAFEYASVSARLMGRRRERAYRGGVRPWLGVKAEIERHLLSDAGLRVGLLVDYYGMPPAWPGRTSSGSAPVALRSAVIGAALLQTLEESMRARFFPCVLMHEFETFVFADSQKAADAWGRADLEPALTAIRDSFPTAEHINDSPETAPSKRLQALIPGYEKPLMGELAVFSIGLATLRRECPSFGSWLTTLEG